MADQRKDPFTLHIEALFNKLDQLTYYQLLNVSSSTGIDDIKIAFYRFARIYHPDLHRDKSQNIQEKVDKIFKRMNEAYRVLTDSHQKKMYEIALARGEKRIYATKSSEKINIIAPEAALRTLDGKKHFKVALSYLKAGNYQLAKLNFQLALSNEGPLPIITNKLKEIDELMLKK